MTELEEHKAARADARAAVDATYDAARADAWAAADAYEVYKMEQGYRWKGTEGDIWVKS